MHGKRSTTDAAHEEVQREYIDKRRRLDPDYHAEVHASDVVLVAYVNEDRYVADCPCGAGISVTPGWPARCLECGAVMSVIFPEE